jgi:hypothetical protein
VSAVSSYHQWIHSSCSTSSCPPKICTAIAFFPIPPYRDPEVRFCSLKKSLAILAPLDALRQGWPLARTPSNTYLGPGKPQVYHPCVLHFLHSFGLAACLPDLAPANAICLRFGQALPRGSGSLSSSCRVLLFCGLSKPVKCDPASRGLNLEELRFVVGRLVRYTSAFHALL